MSEPTERKRMEVMSCNDCPMFYEFPSGNIGPVCRFDSFDSSSRTFNEPAVEDNDDAPPPDWCPLRTQLVVLTVKR